jgi:pyruvate ferredoxin oxidoreductase alpha subunit
MPDYYFELRRQQTDAIAAALPALDALGAELELLAGRRYRALEAYRLDGARSALVAMGSTAGTVKDVVDELRDDGEPVGLLRVCSFRPFPQAAVRQALEDVDEVVVLDRADSIGGTAPLFAEVAAALYGSLVGLRGSVYGLGGRDLHPGDVRRLLAGERTPYLGVRGA